MKCNTKDESDEDKVKYWKQFFTKEMEDKFILDQIIINNASEKIHKQYIERYMW